MLFYAAGSFAITLLNLILAFFTLQQSNKNIVLKAHHHWTLFVTLWSFGYGITLCGLFSYETTLFWNKFCQASACLIGPNFFKLGCCLSKQFDKKRLLYWIYLSFGITVAALIMMSDVVVKGLWSFGIFRYQPLGGPLYLLFTGVFLLSNAHGFFIVLMNYKKEQGLRKKQQRFFLLATGLGYSLSAQLFLQGLGFAIAPHGVFAMFLYVLILWYAIHKYKFLDIQVLLKKTLVFAGLFAMVAITATIITAVIQPLVSNFIHINPRMQIVITGLFILALYQPTRTVLVNLTDRFLFQKKQTVAAILNQLSGEIVTILEIQRISEKILQTLRETMRLASGAILVRDKESGNFQVQDSFGVDRRDLVLPTQSSFISYFDHPDTILHVDHDEEESISAELKETMDDLKAEVAIPLFFQNEHTGVLTLGKKISDQEYTKEEMDVFPTLASQVAIALSNAKLLSEIVKEQTEKEAAQQIAERVNYTRSFKHEGGNKMVGIETAAISLQMFYKKEYEKLSKRLGDKLAPAEAKMLEAQLKLVEKYTSTIEENAQRVSLIMDTVVGALTADETTMQIFDFRIAWETAKRNAQVDRCHRFSVRIEEPFKMYGNVSLIERVFENLLGNSRDALEGKEKPLIHLEGSFREHEGQRVAWFEYWDEGMGVPEDLFNKVFEQGFSTKPKPESGISMEAGHGQGLYVCRKMIEEFHKGKIWLEQREGGGSKFVFWIPAKEGSH